MHRAASEAVDAAVRHEVAPPVATTASVIQSPGGGAIVEREEIVGVLTQFTPSDYLLVLPITLLTIFALGILLIDLMLPA